jgi:hypothetical protein
MSTAVKIKSYRIGARGKRGATISLPIVWAQDLGLEMGSVIDVYRDTSDRLILCPPGVTPETDLTAGQAQELAEALKGRKPTEARS